MKRQTLMSLFTLALLFLFSQATAQTNQDSPQTSKGKENQNVRVVKANSIFTPLPQKETNARATSSNKELIDVKKDANANKQPLRVYNYNVPQTSKEQQARINAMKINSSKAAKGTPTGKK